MTYVFMTSIGNHINYPFFQKSQHFSLSTRLGKNTQ